MKKFLIVLCAVLLFTSGCGKEEDVVQNEPEAPKKEEKLLSTQEALIIGESLYDKADSMQNLFGTFKFKNVGWDSDGFCPDKEDMGTICYAELIDYDKIVNAVFTENGKKLYEANPHLEGNVFRVNNIVKYVSNSSMPGNIMNIPDEDVEVKKIEEDKITYIVSTKMCTDDDYPKTYVCPDNKIQLTSNEFIIKKINDKWLVDVITFNF